MEASELLMDRLEMGDVATDISGVKWLAAGDVDVREMAWSLKAQSARFVTITAYELPDKQGFCLEYLWDLNGQLIGYSLKLADRAAASIFDICEAADWIEREIYEGFTIEFAGRTYEPLLLREGDKPGVNLREVTR